MAVARARKWAICCLVGPMFRMATWLSRPSWETNSCWQRKRGTLCCLRTASTLVSPSCKSQLPSLLLTQGLKVPSFPFVNILPLSTVFPLPPLGRLIGAKLQHHLPAPLFSSSTASPQSSPRNSCPTSSPPWYPFFPSLSRHLLPRQQYLQCPLYPPQITLVEASSLPNAIKRSH